MSNATANDPSNSGLDPVDRIAALLGSDPQTDDPAASDDPGDAEHEAEDPDNEPEPDNDDPDRIATTEEVEFEGHKLKLPKEIASQVRDGLMLKADHTRKAQEIAEQRRAIEQERAYIPQALAQYQQRLTVIDQALRMALPQPPSDDLNLEDPIEYARQANAYGRQLEKLRAIQAEQQWTAAQQQQIDQQHFAQQMRDAASRLPELIPEWRDAKRMQSEQPKIRDYLRAQGYSAEEIGTTSDPRAVAISRKAMLWDQLQQGKQAARPVATRTAPPSAAKPQQGTAQSSDRKAFQRLQKTGSRHDAVGLVGKFLPKE